jgi:hypothetical protein
MSKPTVFLSYSHEDEKWKDELSVQLNVLEDLLGVWDDRQIDGGDSWFDKLRGAMDGAAVAVCLISADYLTSDFCKKEEIPYLLKRRTEQGMRLLPILLRPCPWKLVSWLKAIQILPSDNRPIASLSSAKREQIFAEIAESIGQSLAQPALREEPDRSPRRGVAESETATVYRSFPMAPSSTPSSGGWDLEILGPPPPDSSPGPRVSSAAVDLFGRDAELSWLDDLWEEGTVRVVSITGPPGIGKSALAASWREGVQREQGEKAWSIRILDDAESQPALAAELAQSGDYKLLLLTSRKPLAELNRLPQKLVAHKELGPLSPSAGRALLRVAGVRGTDADLEEISRQLGGLPSALVRRAAG